MIIVDDTATDRISALSCLLASNSTCTIRWVVMWPYLAQTSLPNTSLIGDADWMNMRTWDDWTPNKHTATTELFNLVWSQPFCVYVTLLCPSIIVDARFAQSCVCVVLCVCDRCWWFQQIYLFYLWYLWRCNRIKKKKSSKLSACSFRWHLFAYLLV